MKLRLCLLGRIERGKHGKIVNPITKLQSRKVVMKLNCWINNIFYPSYQVKRLFLLLSLVWINYWINTDAFFVIIFSKCVFCFDLDWFILYATHLLCFLHCCALSQLKRTRKSFFLYFVYKISVLEVVVSSVPFNAEDVILYLSVGKVTVILPNYEQLSFHMF